MSPNRTKHYVYGYIYIYNIIFVPAADEAAACTGRNAAPAAV